MERGNIYKKVTTQDLFEITYLCMVEDISDMASLYELKHRNKNQDTRRLSFAKELELFEQIGEQYYKYHKDRIEDIINKNPYEDG